MSECLYPRPPWLIRAAADGYIRDEFGGQPFVAAHVRPYADECLVVSGDGGTHMLRGVQSLSDCLCFLQCTSDESEALPSQLNHGIMLVLRSTT